MYISIYLYISGAFANRTLEYIQTDLSFTKSPSPCENSPEFVYLSRRQSIDNINREAGWTGGGL